MDENMIEKLLYEINKMKINLDMKNIKLVEFYIRLMSSDDINSNDILYKLSDIMHIKHKSCLCNPLELVLKKPGIKYDFVDIINNNWYCTFDLALKYIDNSGDFSGIYDHLLRFHPQTIDHFIDSIIKYDVFSVSNMVKMSLNYPDVIEYFIDSSYISDIFTYDNLKIVIYENYEETLEVLSGNFSEYPEIIYKVIYDICQFNNDFPINLMNILLNNVSDDLLKKLMNSDILYNLCKKPLYVDKKIELINLFYSYGLNLEYKDAKGRTIFDICILNNNKKILEYLRSIH